MDGQSVKQLNEIKYEYTSPIGILCARTDGEAITGLDIKGEANGEINSELLPILKQLGMELSEYFAGKRTKFTVPVRLEGTDFQKAVWNLLKQIPYGETRTYGELAEVLGKKGAARAVGGACHVNPVLLLVPCHRVIGANGKLTGFAGGLPVKEALLELERKAKQ